jgi:hypothetical protein
MRAPMMTALALAFLASVASSPASAETLRSNVAFNTGIGKKTDNQPPNGIQVAYQIALKGGELDACPVDIIETFTRATREPGASSTSAARWPVPTVMALPTIPPGPGTARASEPRAASWPAAEVAASRTPRGASLSWVALWPPPQAEPPTSPSSGSSTPSRADTSGARRTASIPRPG